MYNFTNKQSEITNVEIDLRHESDALINEFGINMLYIRNCKFVRCRCFDDLNKAGDPNCKICMGSGYFASIQKTQGIESSIRQFSDNNTLLQTPIGITNQKNEVYYVRHSLNPKERDYLLKVTWDKQGVVTDIVKVLEIIGTYEMRGDNGRAELIGCIINDRTDMVSAFTRMLHNLPKKVKQQLTRGGKSIWPAKLLTKID